MFWKNVLSTTILLMVTSCSVNVIQDVLPSKSSINVQLLLDNDQNIRESTFKKIETLNPKESVSLLVKGLKHRDWEVRVISAYTLGKLGNKAESAIPKLISASEDDKADVRFAIAQALGDIGSEKGVSGLIKGLQDQDENVRVSAVYALSQLKEKALPANSVLTQALWDSNWFVRSKAAEILSILGFNAVNLPEMISPLKNLDINTNGAIISLLTAVNPAFLDNPALMSQIFVEGLQSPDPQIRLTSATILGMIRGTNFYDYARKESFNSLVSALNDTNAQVCQSATNALTDTNLNTDEKSQLLAVINSIISGDSPKSQADNLDMLANLINNNRFNIIPEEGLIKEITLITLTALKDKNLEIRYNAVNLLDTLLYLLTQDYSNLSNSFKIEFLQSIYQNLANTLYDTDVTIREKVLEIISSELRKMDENSIYQYGQYFMPELINIIGNPNVEKEIRRGLIISFGNKIVPSLVKFNKVATLKSISLALQDTDDGIRQNTLLMLQELGLLNKNEDQIGLINILSQGLSSSDPIILLDAVSGIGKFIGYKSIDEFDQEISSSLLNQIPKLNTHLQSPFKEIRYASAVTINQINPIYENTIPIFREILSNENDYLLRHNEAIPNLYKIGSPEATLAIAENIKLENEEIKYIRGCSMGYVPLPRQHKYLVVELLKDTDLRQILVENLSFYVYGDEENSESEARTATVNALLALLKKEAISPALQLVFELKNQDIRRSIIYALGELLSKQGSEQTNQKIINVLTTIVNDPSENINIRWMAATSLQKSSIAMDNFFTDNNLINPETVQCAYPKSRQPGMKFDRYEQRCLYDEEVGCGDGPTMIFARLRTLLLSYINGKNNETNKQKNNEGKN